MNALISRYSRHGSWPICLVSLLTACSHPLDYVEAAARNISECQIRQTRAKECEGEHVKALEKAVLEAKKEGVSESQIAAAKELGFRRRDGSSDISPYEKLLRRWAEIDQRELEIRSKMAASSQPGLVYAKEVYADLAQGVTREHAIEKSLSNACKDSDLAQTHICRLHLRASAGSQERLVELPKEAEAVRHDFLTRKKLSQ